MPSSLEPLRLVHPAALPANANAEGVAVAFSFELETGNERLVVDYEVRGRGAPYVNPGLGADRSQWGLWDWDVVELFVRANAEPTYYEFQLSPLGQFFELEIHEPRKRFNKDFVSGFRHVNRLSGDGSWSARFEIPLEAIGWDGRRESLVGNAFAILGEPAARTYWSLYLHTQSQPDFHLPQYFKTLQVR